MRRTLFITISGLFLTMTMLRGAEGKKQPDYLIYIGTYTGPSSKGIYAYRFDANIGKATELGAAGEIANPSFLALDPSRTLLYAVSERAGGGRRRAGAAPAAAWPRRSRCIRRAPAAPWFPLLPTDRLSRACRRSWGEAAEEVIACGEESRNAHPVFLTKEFRAVPGMQRFRPTTSSPLRLISASINFSSIVLIQVPAA